MPVFGSFVMASSGQALAQTGSAQCLQTFTRQTKSSFPFMGFGPSGQTDRYLTPLSDWTGLYSCLQATSQVLHPQQAYSSIISAYLFMADLLVFGRYPAKECPYV